MAYQCNHIHTRNCYRPPLPFILFVFVLLLYFGTAGSGLGSPIEKRPVPEGAKSTISEDTTKTPSGYLPLAKNARGQSCPRFETAHLVIGLGGMYSDYSDLDQLNIDQSSLSMQFSVYANIPLSPDFYFLGGWEFGGKQLFKSVFLYQTGFRLIFGVGGGMTWYSYDGDNYLIDAFHKTGLLVFGVNLSPQIVNFLVTVPVGSSLSTNFDGRDYSIKPIGVQFSLQFSLR